jgi:hypothetical protein
MESLPLNYTDEDFRYVLARELDRHGYMNRNLAFNSSKFIELFNAISKKQYLVHEEQVTKKDPSSDEVEEVATFKYVNMNHVHKDILLHRVVEDLEELTESPPTFYEVTCQEDYRKDSQLGDGILVTENNKKKEIEIHVWSCILTENLVLYPVESNFYFPSSYLVENLSEIVDFLQEFMNCERNNPYLEDRYPRLECKKGKIKRRY